MFKKNQKGQIAIEFIMLIGILLLFFYSMILPSIEFSEEVILDTYNLVQTKESLSKLSTTMESFSSSISYGKRKIFLYLPNEAQINGCDINSPNVLYATINVAPQNAVLSSCNVDGVCILVDYFYSSLNVTCNVIPLGYKGYVTIEKTESGDISYYVE
jgi:hypothetical protein